MDNKAMEVYNLLAKHGLQSFFSPFTQILNVYQKRKIHLISAYFLDNYFISKEINIYVKRYFDLNGYAFFIAILYLPYYSVKHIFMCLFLFLGDFVLLSRKDLQKVGLLTRSSVKIFEALLLSLKNDEKVY